MNSPSDATKTILCGKLCTGRMAVQPMDNDPQRGSQARSDPAF